MTPARLGRLLAATLVTPDLEASCEAYARWLHLTVAHRTRLTPALAALLGRPQLGGARAIWLGDGAGAWLRLVESCGARVPVPMRRHGWLALEVLVGDVDRLVAGLEGSPFRVLGPPADLELSPKIRASQVLGPSGELLYLTQIREPVPPFELPMTAAPVDRPFVAVVSTPNREATRAAWEALAARRALAFETRITVLNRAFGRPLEARYPVSVLQLRDRCLIEIDEVEPRWVDASDPGDAGLLSLAMACDTLDRPDLGDAISTPLSIDEPPYGGRRVASWRGPEGAAIELIETR